MKTSDPIERVSVLSTGRVKIRPDPRQASLPGLRWERIEPQPTDDAGLLPFRESHDLFADGSLVLPRPPGHTPGSMSFLVCLSGQPPLVMVGELTDDVHVLEDGHVPGVGSRRRLRRSTALVNQLRQRMRAR